MKLLPKEAEKMIEERAKIDMLIYNQGKKDTLKQVEDIIDNMDTDDNGMISPAQLKQSIKQIK